MTDRELLEMAAKAAGIELLGWSEIQSGFKLNLPLQYWNPLTDDGDALRLLVDLSIKGEGLRLMLPAFNDAWAVVDDYSSAFKVREFNKSDPYAATRRVIVRAAAEIGRSMQAEQAKGE